VRTWRCTWRGLEAVDQEVVDLREVVTGAETLFLGQRVIVGM